MRILDFGFRELTGKTHGARFWIAFLERSLDIGKSIEKKAIEKPIEKREKRSTFEGNNARNEEARRAVAAKENKRAIVVAARSKGSFFIRKLRKRSEEMIEIAKSAIDWPIDWIEAGKRQSKMIVADTTVQTMTDLTDSPFSIKYDLPF